MNWWNKYKNKVSLVLIICILIGFLATIGLMLLGPVIGDTFCTLVGCGGGGIHVNFVGEMPKSYTIIIDFPSGAREVECDGTPSQNDHGYCTKSGAFLAQLYSEQEEKEPPKEIAVSVEYDGKIISKTFQPDYDVMRPNGENCEPMCYFATIEFDLSE